MTNLKASPLARDMGQARKAVENIDPDRDIAYGTKANGGEEIIAPRIIGQFHGDPARIRQRGMCQVGIVQTPQAGAGQQPRRTQ